MLLKSSAEFMVLYHSSDSTYHDKKTTVPGLHPWVRLPESFPSVLSYCTQAMPTILQLFFSSLIRKRP
jgi:hypothetical protein